MKLYHLSLSKATAIQSAIFGNFTAPKAQEIMVSRGKILELLRPDENGRMVCVHSQEVFGLIRQMSTFRLEGQTKDMIVLGTDAGRVVILDYSKEKGLFVKIHQETFGRSGIRRITPGQYVAVDTRGRAIMVASVEKQKFVYIMSRDNEGNVTISSPLEAHKSSHICYSVCALDTGFYNPTFAAIELDYSDADQDPTGEAASQAQKILSLYELDLGLNHVVRKWENPIDNGANLLIPVPGDKDGPGGVLVCAENFIIYKNMDHPDVRTVIPRRADLPPDRGVLIVASAMHKQKSQFFFLVQSEYGDIYKVTLAYQKKGANKTVEELKVKYFDSIPPCTSLCILKTGYLFAASEFGNHALYVFTGIGEDQDDVEASSAFLVETDEGFKPVFFEPRPFKNLNLIYEPFSLSPITDMKVANLTNDDVPQIYCACGRGPRSTLRVLKQGMAVQEMAQSPLPAYPQAVFTIKRSRQDEHDAYIIITFPNATLVLSIGETVLEVNDSGFLSTISTLQVQLLSDGSMLQVHQNGLRLIKPDKRTQQWQAPAKKQILHAATNKNQVVIAMTGGELVYFEVDQGGQLSESERKDMMSDVTAISIGPIPEGRLRCRFLAVATSDRTVRILGLDPGDNMKQLALQAHSEAVPQSILLLQYMPVLSEGEGADIVGENMEAARDSTSLFLHVGLTNGALQRTEVDRTTGNLGESRTRFLGALPPKLFTISVQKRLAMLALGSRPWMGYMDNGSFKQAPLSYSTLDFASAFSSEQCPEGFVAISKNTLRILTLERFGETFKQEVMRLRYTPKKIMPLLDQNRLISIEGDYQSIPLSERDDLKQMMETEDAGNILEEGIESNEERAAIEDQFGAPRGAVGQWASCVRLIDPSDLTTDFVEELEDNQVAVSVTQVEFSNNGELGTLLAVGCASNLKFAPRSSEGGAIRLYQISEEGNSLKFLHSTSIDGIPLCMTAFQGKLLCGVGNVLRLYDLGKKKLLRKSEMRKFPTQLISLTTEGDRIYVGDMQESIHYLKYRKSDSSFYCFADDLAPRYMTCQLQLDYDTVCAADKFGNIFVTRLRSDVSQTVEKDPTGGKFVNATGWLNGAPHKLDNIIQFYVGEVVTSLQRCTLQAGGREVILYGTIMGTIGALLPFTNKEVLDFMETLELNMRQANLPLSGHDHMKFRSYYLPVKSVVDGDICEQFAQMSQKKQNLVSEEMERTQGEIMKYVEDMRNRIL